MEGIVAVRLHASSTVLPHVPSSRRTRCPRSKGRCGDLEGPLFPVELLPYAAWRRPWIEEPVSPSRLPTSQLLGAVGADGGGKMACALCLKDDAVVEMLQFELWVSPSAWRPCLQRWGQLRERDAEGPGAKEGW